MKSHFDNCLRSERFDNDKVSDILNAYESFENRKARKKLAEKLKREREMRIIWASVAIFLTVIFFAYYGYGLHETARTQAQSNAPTPQTPNATEEQQPKAKIDTSKSPIFRLNCAHQS